MLVFVVRYGESETNQKWLWTGWLNVKLTDKGREDAKKVGKFLKKVSFDKVYTSDLIRAIETAETAIPNCSYEKTELLREINVGKIANNPLSVLTPEERLYASKNGYGAYEGETKSEFQKRVLQFIKYLEQLNCENVAVFSHAGWMREMSDLILETQLPRQKICCNNCAVAVFEYNGAAWRLHSWSNLL